MCPGKKCVAIIDTGSNIIAGPSAALIVLKRKLDVKYDCSNLDQLPPIEFSLGDFQVSLPASAYVIKVKLPSWAPFKHSTAFGHAHARQVLGGEDGTAKEMLSNLSFTSLWDTVIQDLHKKLGLDLRTALEGAPLEGLSTGEKLCIPAFVPLNKVTTRGPLWVVGTPLFERYYARWSWPLNESSPRIYIKERQEAEACQHEPSQPNSSSRQPPTALATPESGSVPGLLRTERRITAPVVAPTQEVPLGPPEWEADEIRFPHWAKAIEDL